MTMTPTPPALDGARRAELSETPPHVTAVMGRLRRWANRLRGRYGVPIYLCGSALRADNTDPRDWDVRIMLPDERFALAFGPVDEWRDEGCTGHWTRTRFRWSDQCVKDTKDFAAWCHLNGDVQIYPESHAATLYAKEPRLRLDTFPDDGWTDHYAPSARTLGQPCPDCGLMQADATHDDADTCIRRLRAALEAGEADTREVDAVRACIAIVDSVARSRGSHITPEVIAAANTMANAMRALLGEVARSPLPETTHG